MNTTLTSLELGDNVFKELIKLKQGHQGGHWSNIISVFTIWRLNPDGLEPGQAVSSLWTPVSTLEVPAHNPGPFLHKQPKPYTC